MRFCYYVFDKSIYEYKECEDWLEIRRKDGKDINYNGDLEADEFSEILYNSLLKREGKELAEKYKNSCNPKVYSIWSEYYQVIDNNDLENHVGVDVFIVVDRN